MHGVKHKALVLFAVFGTLAAASAGADAKAVAPERACPGLCPSALASVWRAGTAPRRDDFETDTDSANANNPALPPYARGRGQETGGPARALIPN